MNNLMICSQCYIIFGTFHMIFTCFTQLKKPAWEILEGLVPQVLVILYMLMAFSYTELAWRAPAVVLLTAGLYFCLSVTRMIIATVTK